MPKEALHPAAVWLIRSALQVGEKAARRALGSVLEDIENAAEDVRTRSQRARERVREKEPRGGGR